MRKKAIIKWIIVTVLVCIVIHFITPSVRDAGYQAFVDSCVPPVWANNIWWSRIRMI